MLDYKANMFCRTNEVAMTREQLDAFGGLAGCHIWEI